MSTDQFNPAKAITTLKQNAIEIEKKYRMKLDENIMDKKTIIPIITGKELKRNFLLFNISLIYGISTGLIFIIIQDLQILCG